MRKNSAWKLVITVATACVMGLSLCACGEGSSQLPDYSADKPITSPLTGMVYDDEIGGRPLIVSIDNVGEAIPQSNLSYADMVYEFPVEGLQTRLEAVFMGDFPECFGPIRSTRPYFVDLTREMKGVFLAHGWSGAARRYLQKGYVPYINAMNSELHFYRVADKPGPHDSYIKWSTVKGKIKKEGWWKDAKKPRSFKFLHGSQKGKGAKATKISFRYSYSNCEFTYDSATNSYKRTISGTPYIDKENGKQIAVNNVLVQRVKSRVYDHKGRLKINMTKGGKAMLFTGGKVIKGTWSRKNLNSRTIFKDKNGKEFRLTPGKTWVEVADQNCTIKY